MSATAALRAALGPGLEAPGPAGLLGLEHEYRLARDGEPLDFRTLIHNLDIPGRRLDPGDGFAYRCASGLSLTCDDDEAEIACPPVPLSPRFATELDGWAQAGRALVQRVVPWAALTGYSTHLSAAVDDDLVDEVADSFVARFAPAVMLVLDRPGSHGIYVRPRPGRLELCGEYAIGDRLRAAAVLFAGAVRACANESAGSLPPRLHLNAVPARGRSGLQVDRRAAFGFDLYEDARRRVLPLAGGGTEPVQGHLVDAWSAARIALGDDADTAGSDVCDRMVDGSLALGVETADDGEAGDAVDGAPAPSPFGDLLTARRRRGSRVEAVVATWAFTVFEVSDGGRRRYACLPRTHLAAFLAALDAGRLDGVIATAMAGTGGARLEHFGQTREPGFWDELAASPALAPWERGQVAAQTWGGRAGKPPSSPTLPVASIPDEPPRRPVAVVTAGRPARRPRRPWRVLVWLVPVLVTGGLVVVAAGREDVQTVSPITQQSTVPTTVPTTIPATTVTTGGTTTLRTTTVPSTTTPPPTTGPSTSGPSTSAGTTTSTLPAVRISVTPGCGFKPPTTTFVRGATVIFENVNSVAVTVRREAPLGAPPANYVIGPGQDSPIYVFSVLGTHTFSCTGPGMGALDVTVS